jgi:hypothetical protein
MTTVAAMVPWRDLFGRVDPIPDAVADQDASPTNLTKYVDLRSHCLAVWPAVQHSVEGDVLPLNIRQAGGFVEDRAIKRMALQIITPRKVASYAERP